MEPKPAKRVMKRCPACNAKAELEAFECAICGHEFGTTMPNKAVAYAPAKEVAQPKSEAQQPTPDPGPSTSTTALPPPPVPRRLPLGVIGVLGFIALLALGSVFLLNNREFVNRFAPTPTPPIKVAMAATTVPTTVPLPMLAPTAIVPSVIPQTPTPVVAGLYTVREGDVCGNIAEQNNIGLSVLIRFNNLDENCIIRPGERLRIPGPTPIPGPAPTLRPGENIQPTRSRPARLDYEVKPDDVCSVIAERFGISVDRIIEDNKLDDDCTIRIGQKLQLTFGTADAPATALVVVTPTPRNGYAAPLLMGPLEGAQITDTADLVNLQWLTVGLLRDNEWYVVQVQPEGQPLVPIWETKATSLKISPSFLEGQTQRKLTWWVSVKRLISSSPNGTRVYEDRSTPSLPRSFIWGKKQ